MRKLFGGLAVTSLTISIAMVVFFLLSPLYVLILTPYLVLTSALTLSTAVMYFYLLNQVKSKSLNFFIYTVALVPLLIPALACFDPDLMENYWHQFLSLTILQMGIGVLGATFFFRNPKLKLSTVLSVLAALTLFIMGILVVLKSGLLSSIPFLMTIAAIISVFFLLSVILRLKEIN